MSKRIGLIGAGKWGANFLKTIEAMPGADVVIVCTRRGFPVEGYKTTINVTDVIDANVDGVIIATPPEDHYKLALKFLENKIPVFLEKPISTKLIECQNLLLTAKASDTVFRVNYTHLYSPAFKLLKQEVDSWGDDQIRVVSAGGNIGPFRHYDSLQDYGPHDLSMIISLLGIPHNYEVFEDRKAQGSIYKINMFFDKGTSTSYVGNGFDKKYRNFTVQNLSNEKYVIYNDLSEDKLKINGKKVNISEDKPLSVAVQSFINSLGANSNWREELEVSKHLSLVLNSPVSAIQ